jgi:hypothetical protein
MKSLYYVFRDVFLAVLVYKLAWKIDPLSLALIENRALPPIVAFVVKWLSWASYWYLQGIILAGWWCMAHEAGHGTLSPYNWVNHLIGYTMHTVSC